MKKITSLSVLGFFVAVFFIASTGLAGAETGSSRFSPFMPYPNEGGTGTSDDSTSSGGSGSGGFGGIGVNLKTKAEFEAEVKAREARCESLRETEKEICKKELEVFKTRYEARIKAELNSNTNTSGNVDRSGSNDNNKDRKELIRKYFGDFSGRFGMVIEKLEATLERITKLADRIESRLKKLSAENVDVTASTKFLGEARAELKLAKAGVEEVKAIFKEELAAGSKNTDSGVEVSVTGFQKCKAAGGTIEQSKPLRCSLGGTTYVNAEVSMLDVFKTPRSAFTKTIAQIKVVKEHLMKAHRNLVMAIVNWKPGLNKIDKTDDTDKTKVNASVNVDASAVTTGQVNP